MTPPRNIYQWRQIPIIRADAGVSGSAGETPAAPPTARRGGPLRGASAHRGGPLRGAGALGCRIPAGSEGRQRIGNLILAFFTSEGKWAESHKSGITVGLAPLSEYHYHKSHEFEGQTVQLRELCRICLTWAEHAQALLFRNICVRYENRKHFFALLNTKHDLGRHIMGLKIEGGLSSHISIQEELHFIEQLPNVHTLHILKCFVHPLTKWTMVSRLCLENCNFETAGRLHAIIAAFPLLESLCVSQCRDTARTAASPVTRPAWHLKYLALGFIPQLIAWMVTEPAALAVDHLRILSFGSDASVFNAVLNKIGGGLRQLDLPAIFTKSGSTVVDHEHAILSLLAQVDYGSPCLTTVSFRIILGSGYQDVDVQWEQIDARLTTEAFARLDRVELCIFKGAIKSQVSSASKAKLAQVTCQVSTSKLQVTFKGGTSRVKDSFVPVDLYKHCVKYHICLTLRVLRTTSFDAAARPSRGHVVGIVHEYMSLLNTEAFWVKVYNAKV
ncbi:hypothetical protein GGX14DRAFT_396009 [Mycena pura]|uniref:Uncharacterized protein n=1 Tax=Mycena pura TaxID=153505 RepID=A0AAD6VCQ3_9AGAR|nr:hypothetical protein GGX14DRAFT_396009 [Mycena pura]